MLLLNGRVQKDRLKEIELAVASSIGADLAMAFLTEAKIPVKHVFLMADSLHRLERQHAESWSHSYI